LPRSNEDIMNLHRILAAAALLALACLSACSAAGTQSIACSVTGSTNITCTTSHNASLAVPTSGL
jgi:hypothetical protein